LKYVKRIAGLILVLCVLMMPVGASAAKSMESEKIEPVNVAKGKPVYAAATDQGGTLTNGELGDRLDPANSNYTGADVTLPTGDVVSGADSAATDWYIIDLEDEYEIKEIRLYSRGDEPSTTINWMGHFKIEVSNSILFPEDETVLVGGVGDTLEGTGITSRATPFVGELDGKEAYRYIRIKKTAWSYFGWAELEAYVDMTVIDPYGNATFKEVSKNKLAEVNYGSYYDGETVGNWSPDKVVDGKFSDSQGWIIDGVSDRPSAPYNLVVDLEEELPITKIEMFGRPNVSVELYRKNWKVYGFTEEEGKPDISGEITGGTLLLDITSPFPQITDTQNPDGDDGLSEIVDNSVPFRYLVFSKTANELGCLTEIRAYVVVPIIEDVQMVNAQKIEMSFSEAIDEATVADGIEVKVNGEKVSANITVTDDTASIDLGKEYFDSQIEVKVKEGLKTKFNIAFEEEEFKLYTPKAVSAELEWVVSEQNGAGISDMVSAVTNGKAAAKVTVENNTSTDAATVIVLTVLYDENNFAVASSEKRVTVEAMDSETIVSGFAIPSEVTSANADNYKLKAYVWKDFNILKPWIKSVTLGE